MSVFSTKEPLLIFNFLIISSLLCAVLCKIFILELCLDGSFPFKMDVSPPFWKRILYPHTICLPALTARKNSTKTETQSVARWGFVENWPFSSSSFLVLSVHDIIWLHTYWKFRQNIFKSLIFVCIFQELWCNSWHI